MCLRRGLPGTHDRAQSRTCGGTTMAQLDVAERIAARQAETGPVPVHRPELPPCKWWPDATDTDGYGVIKVGGKKVRVHVVVAEAAAGRPARPGHTWDHACHDPETCACGRACMHRRCYESTHLEEVPDRVNIVDRSGSPPAVNARKSHCLNEHPLDGPAALVYSPPKRPGRRYCVHPECQPARAAASYRRKTRRIPGPGQISFTISGRAGMRACHAQACAQGSPQVRGACLRASRRTVASAAGRPGGSPGANGPARPASAARRDRRRWRHPTRRRHRRRRMGRPPCS